MNPISKQLIREILFLVEFRRIVSGNLCGGKFFNFY